MKCYSIGHDFLNLFLVYLNRLLQIFTWLSRVCLHVIDNVVITCKHIADWCGLSFQINSGETLILPSNQCEREADMESEQQWTFTQKQLINDYRIYYQNMGLLVNEIDSNGPTGKMPKLPKKPKQRLSDVYGKVNKEKMTPQELHKYLIDNSSYHERFGQKNFEQLYYVYSV